MKRIRKWPRKRKRRRIDDVYRRLFLYCPHDLYRSLAEIALDNGCSLEFVVRDACERYVNDISGHAADAILGLDETSYTSSAIVIDKTYDRKAG